MTLDPLVADIIKNFILPVITWTGVIYAFNLQNRNQKPHPITYGIVKELVVVGTFKAENLINIGMLEPEKQTDISPLEMLRLIRGG